jgi:hypothetical protein
MLSTADAALLPPGSRCRGSRHRRAAKPPRHVRPGLAQTAFSPLAGRRRSWLFLDPVQWWPRRRRCALCRTWQAWL